MVEVRRDARLHDACHVPYRSKAAGASCEERQDGKAPPLPVQPGDDAGNERLSCGDPDSVQQGQSVAEQAAERHVPPLQPGLCGGEKQETVTSQAGAALLLRLLLLSQWGEGTPPGGLNVTTPSSSVSS